MNDKNNGNMKTIAEIQGIIEEKYTFIPLLQRNYKWSREYAVELAEDLWDAYNKDKDSYYQLNMITIYSDEKNNSFQILDGQQRMITLKLLLTVLDVESIQLNYDFERDYMIDQRSGRRYFMNNILPKAFNIIDVSKLSVDTLRLWENFNAMILPLSFRAVYDFYNKCLINANNKENAGEGNSFDKVQSTGILRTDIVSDEFKKEFNNKVVDAAVDRCIQEDNRDSLKEKLYFAEEDIEKTYELCVIFQKESSKTAASGSDNEDEKDEVRISCCSEEFQEIWLKKVSSCYEKDGWYSIYRKYKKEVREDNELRDYILNHVEMLYHETTSEPIDEFLNINENKTRFVISDYIRAKMISDNPVDKEELTENQKKTNQDNRKEVLAVFTSLSEYLYADEYLKIWKLVKTRYDDFDTHPDINRLKVLFCDKYFGTNTKGYVFEEELARLNYFKYILEALQAELNLDCGDREVSWSTYNAVYMLLECKKRYKFFSIFEKEDIEKRNILNDVVARERFCFFETAYNKAKESEDIWDISYFLQSQLYDDECVDKKKEALPQYRDNPKNEWCWIDRGSENDELHKCLKQLIDIIKTGGVK